MRTRLLLIFFFVLIVCLGLTAYGKQEIAPHLHEYWPYDQGLIVKSVPHPKGTEYVSFGSYGSETDWNDPTHILPLDYHQADGKRIFYQQCVWCHSDTTPAGPSNRSNVTPTPPLMNDGTLLNGVSDAELQRVIALGGAATGKSAMMPPYGKSLTPDEIYDVVAYTRAIASPAYPRPSHWSWTRWEHGAAKK